MSKISSENTNQQIKVSECHEQSKRCPKFLFLSSQVPAMHFACFKNQFNIWKKHYICPAIWRIKSSARTAQKLYSKCINTSTTRSDMAYHNISHHATTLKHQFTMGNKGGYSKKLGLPLGWWEEIVIWMYLLNQYEFNIIPVGCHLQFAFIWRLWKHALTWQAQYLHSE